MLQGISDGLDVGLFHEMIQSNAEGLIHYGDVIMSTMASQITSLTIVYSTVYSGADQRKHQSSASLVFVRGSHRCPVNSPLKGPVTRKMFHLMTSSCSSYVDYILRGISIISFALSIHCGSESFAANWSLTHWGRDKMAAISRTTLWNSFSWMKMC